MKRSRAAALQTREAILAGALQAFARHGVGRATFQHVAGFAGVTRGAVYWHFTDRASLVREVFRGLRWPLDIGPDLQPYLQCHNPLALLRETLVAGIEHGLADARQRALLALLLSLQHSREIFDTHDSRPDRAGEVVAPSSADQAVDPGHGLPPDLQTHWERQVADASARLVAVCALAEARGLLRPGCHPKVLGACLHALALDCLRGQCLSGLGAPAPQHRQAITWLLQGAALSQT
ncbi:MAG: TetR family transcriptional regulator [Curvibacter sp.]|nr:MAG: TetR family transcriptional regulator [Curvibacter sp.]